MSAIEIDTDAVLSDAWDRLAQQLAEQKIDLKTQTRVSSFDPTNGDHVRALEDRLERLATIRLDQTNLLREFSEAFR